MSYYGNSRNNNNWKNNQHDDQTIDISSGQPPTNEFETEFYRKTPVSSATANVVTKQYNDILERQGIPTITPEDFQILRECGRESLFYRCLPFTAALCTGIVFTARTRQWKPSFYHYLGAVFVGYFTGKISYRGICEERLINSRSNSPFVNAIRKRRGIHVEEFSDPSSSDPRFSNDQSSGFDSSWNTTSQSGKSYGISEFDRDDRPQNSFGLQDDSFVDENNDGSGGQPLNRGGTSYDELRMRNRSAFKNV